MRQLEANEFTVTESIQRLQQREDHHPATVWVAATGKTELFVRDHLGADLAAHNPNLIVAREWHKHDLVILDSDVAPLVIVEGKHLYDFDLLQKGLKGRYKKAISQDCKKMRERNAPTSLVSLLMTSVRSPIPESLLRVTKYSPGINKALKKHGPDLMDTAIGEAREFLADFGDVVLETELASGQVMNLDLHLWMWLVKVG